MGRQIGGWRLTQRSLYTLLGSILALTMVLSASAQAPVPQNSTPQVVQDTSFTYQGRLRNNNSAVSGTCSMEFRLFDSAGTGTPPTGGTQIGPVISQQVTVSSGLFQVPLSFDSPGTPSVFNGDARWLEIRAACPAGGALSTLTPREKLTPTPYAIRALSASWNGLTDVPSGFADGVDNGYYKNMIVVAKDGGQFTSISAALASIPTTGAGAPGATNRYLVWVAPGVYNEQVTTTSFVDLKGAGPQTTVISGAFTASVRNIGAATLRINNVENITVSDLSVLNQGTTSFSFGIIVNAANVNIVLDNVVADANGVGGVIHEGVSLTNSSPTVRGSTIRASGASTNNAVSINSTGSTGTPSVPTIMDSTLIATGGTSIGLSLFGSGAVGRTINILNSVIDASSGIESTMSAGSCTLRVHGSRITTPGTLASSGNQTLTNSGVCNMRVGTTHLDGGATSDATGGGTLICVLTYAKDYSALSSCPKVID